MGYGKGYYDRFLPLIFHAFICGVALSLQVVDDVMPHSKDFHIPCLVTERDTENTITLPMFSNYSEA